MFKNVATKIAVFAFDSTTSLPKSGDAANITAYVSKDYGAVTVLGDTSATEMDATNAKGWYLFDVAQAETNADALLFSGKSSTANIVIVGQYIFTTPNRFSSLVIDSAGAADANMTKAGLTGAGTAVIPRYTGTGRSGTTSTTFNFPASTPVSNAGPGDIILITGGTAVGQSNTISTVTGMGGATPSATMVQAWVVTPDNTSTYEVIKVGGLVPATATSIWDGTINPTRTLTAATNITSTGAAVPIDGSGNVTAAVAAMAANTLTASALASDAVTEMQLGLSTLTQVDIRTAVGLASANLDTQLAALVNSFGLSTVVEGTHTFGQLLKLYNSVLLAKVSGMAGTLVTFRDIDDSKNRVTASVDSSGNRTAVTLDAS